MAIVSGDTAQKAATGFATLPIGRQLGLLLGIAASVAMGFAVVLWSREPNYHPIYHNINSPEASEILSVLQKADIKFKIDNQQGVILVPASKIYNARIKLAAEGLPRSGGQAFNMFGKAQGFGSSQFMESARYKHALEADLAQTITNFRNVKKARVHLAIPKQSVFMRDKRKTSASVFLELYSGSRLKPSQVASIVHLISSSIPEMSSDDVTVVDQSGRLLTDGGSNDLLALANRQLSYKQQLEDSYSKKIHDLLVPILGAGKIKARVSADIDFTSSAQTTESFSPDKILRSEQIMEEQRSSGSGASGIPGALSNKPPSKAKSKKAKTAKQGNNAVAPINTRKQATRNYELDKTISHVQRAAGSIKRLSVAVVVDNKTTVDPKGGEATSTPLSDDELKNITILVKNAIGFNEQRGDNVNVINTAFIKPEAVGTIPEESFMQQAWVWDAAKQATGGLFVLFLIFGVIRPLLRNLATRPVPEPHNLPHGQAGGAAAMTAAGGMRLPGPLQSYEDRMQVVQGMADKDPQRVAQVVKSWVDNT